MFVDYNNEAAYNRVQDAYLTYVPGNNANEPTRYRALGLQARITPDVLGLGSSAYSNRDTPPGWDELENPSRSHLLAKSLGGSGVDVRNIVAMENYANTVVMKGIEERVLRLVKDYGCHITVVATPKYSDHKAPDYLLYKAWFSQCSQDYDKHYEWFSAYIYNSDSSDAYFSVENNMRLYMSDCCAYRNDDENFYP